MTGTLESFHVPDAMGWDLQIGNKIAAEPLSTARAWRTVLVRHA